MQDSAFFLCKALHFYFAIHIFGVVSAENEPSYISKIIQYKTIYETICDLDFKIKLSFKKAIEYAYSTNVQEQFSLLKNSSVEEFIVTITLRMHYSEYQVYGIC